MWREPHNLRLQDSLGLELARAARSYSRHLIELGNLHRLPWMKQLLRLHLLVDCLVLLGQAKQIFVQLLAIQNGLVDLRRTRRHLSVQEASTAVSLDG